MVAVGPRLDHRFASKGELHAQDRNHHRRPNPGRTHRFLRTISLVEVTLFGDACVGFTLGPDACGKEFTFR